MARSLSADRGQPIVDNRRPDRITIEKRNPAKGIMPAAR